jgi:hypothetical protein
VSYVTDNDLAPLKDQEEVLLRQVHPLQYLVDGKLSSVAFYPSEEDEGVMSTRREVIGAERACLEWLKTHKSAGTWGVSVGEFSEHTIETTDDSSLPEQPEGHASADYTHMGDGARRKKGRKIRDHAWDRGPLYRNPAVPMPVPAPEAQTDNEDTSLDLSQ